MQDIFENKQINYSNVQLKYDEEQGIITAIVSTDSIDRDGDIMEKGCFGNIQADQISFLLEHNRDRPIGKWLNFEQQDNNLIGYAKINLDLFKGEGISQEMLEVYKNIKNGVYKFSVGFKVLESTNIDGIRYIKKAMLFEVSLVSVPANGGAKMLNYKKFDPETFEACKKDLEEVENEEELIDCLEYYQVPRTVRKAFKKKLKSIILSIILNKNNNLEEEKSEVKNKPAEENKIGDTSLSKSYKNDTSFYDTMLYDTMLSEFKKN